MHISRAERARTGRTTTGIRATAAGAVAMVLALALAGCGGSDSGSAKTGRQPDSSSSGESGESGEAASQKADPTGIPGVGARLRSKIPDESRQVVAVRGKGKNSPDSTVSLYLKHGDKWSRDRSWTSHNGRKGWTPDHREGDKRSPVGVFTLTDAGGVLADPGSALPYTHSESFTPAPYWPEATRHDFDHVIAVNYNRVEGTTPIDPTRPEGRSKGGSIWLHMDHGYGTSGCVSLSKSGMEHLLRTLDPEKHPAVVMGDKAALAR